MPETDPTIDAIHRHADALGRLIPSLVADGQYLVEGFRRLAGAVPPEAQPALLLFVAGTYTWFRAAADVLAQGRAQIGALDDGQQQAADAHHPSRN